MVKNTTRTEFNIRKHSKPDADRESFRTLTAKSASDPPDDSVRDKMDWPASRASITRIGQAMTHVGMKVGVDHAGIIREGIGVVYSTRMLLFAMRCPSVELTIYRAVGEIIEGCVESSTDA